MASQNVVTITESNFEAEVLKSPTPVLLDFWAPWCGPCLMIGPVIDEIADGTVGTAKIGKVNVDENGALAGRFGINGIPTMLFFKDGKLVEQVSGGNNSKASLLGKLTALTEPAK